MLSLIQTIIAKKLRQDQWLRPSILHLAVSNRCNARCTICRLWSETDKRDVPIDALERYRNSRLGKHLKILQVTGGEPFLSDLPEIIRRLDNGKLQTIIISTNASMPEKTARDLAAISKITKAQILINISLYGLQETHDRIRGIPDGYEKAMRTIALLRKLSLPRCAIIWKMTLLKENIDEINACFEEAARLGVEFSSKPGDNYVFLKNAAHDFHLSPNECDRIITNLTSIIREMQRPRYFIGKTFWERFFIITNIQFHKQLIPYYQLLKNRKEEMAFPCYAAFFSSVLFYDGKLYSCAKLMKPLGSLINQDADAVWLSQNAKKVREFIRQKECSCFSQCDQMPAMVIQDAWNIFMLLLKSYRPGRHNAL